MGDVVTFRARPANRPTDPPTAEDWRDEVTALHAEAIEVVAMARPIVAQLVVYGQTASPLVLARARALQNLLDRAEHRSLGGAA